MIGLEEHARPVVEFQRWVEGQLEARGWSSAVEASFTRLAGDAGLREYWRVAVDTRTWLAVRSPPSTENNSVFCHLASVLIGAHVSAPEIYASDLDQGWLLLEDFGDRLLLNALNEESDNACVLYGQALMTLLAIQQISRDSVDLPTYSQELLIQEMNICDEWFVGKLLAIDEIAFNTDGVYSLLATSAQAQPQVFVHRDYHSRNLVERDGAPLGVIDFQDAVWGPVTYDLVSLLKDCYILWPRERVSQWLATYLQLAQDVGLLLDVTLEQLQIWFDLMGLQRHIKVLGVFARLALHYEKPGYLRDLPLVLHYVVDTAERYPETRSYAEFVKRTVMPRAKQQAWYKDIVEPNP